MHHHLEVHLYSNKNVDAVIEAMLAPYDENLQVESYEEDGETYWGNPDGLWDWYQIGGRWTGSHDGYNPETDPDNQQNGKVKWPTDWKRHDGDIAPVSSIPDDMTASHLLVNGEVVELGDEETVKEKLLEMGVKDGYLVTVDFHS